MTATAAAWAVLLLTQYRQTDTPETWDPLTVTWQRAHCPGRKDLRPFAAGRGRLFEATVLQLGDTRLYLPTAWHRSDGLVPWSSPAPRGIELTMGGAGRTLDEAGRTESGAMQFPNDNGYPSECLGHVHRIVRGGNRREVDPDFYLTLRFRFASSNSPSGAPFDHGATVYGFYGFQTLQFTYNAGGVPDRVYEGAPAMVFPSRPGAPETRMVDGQAMTFRETADGQYVSWRVTPEIVESFEVTRRAPPEHAAVLERKASSIWRWLQTPPARRDNGGTMTF